MGVVFRFFWKNFLHRALTLYLDSWKKVENFDNAKNFQFIFSCNALVDDRMMVYGGLPGDDNYRKISEVKDCGVKEKGLIS